MTAFRADLALLEQFVDRAAAFGASLDGVREGVESRMSALHVVWTGAAADEHAAAHATWQRGAAEMAEAVATLRRVAAVAQANYGAASTANRAMWAG